MISTSKLLFYLIEFINAYTSIYYSNFLFFYLRNTFGFGEVANLLTAAAGGFVYIIAAWQGGKLAQRFGYIRILSLGIFIVFLSFVTGMIFPKPAAQVLVYCLWTVGICFIWPALEAVVCDRAGASLSRVIGIYNITWAAGAAVAYFTAGILIEKLGILSLFWLPMGLMIIELALVPFAANRLNKEYACQCHEMPLNTGASPFETRLFQRMAWLANPFCYVAINTVIPLIPSIAEKLHLSTGMAGIVGSLWMFTRMAAFAALWQWTGWHYRFRWLAGSYLLLIICFFGVLVSPSLGWFLTAQVGFGFSIGFIYYSSLFYSMNVLENQCANAGFHEAMIGLGFFIGPACGAATLYFIPTAIGSEAWSVGSLLCAGFSGLLFLKYYRSKSKKVP
ncbi:MAG: MFS transporter [Smithella sp.]